VLSAPLRGLGALAVRGLAAQRHGADTGLTTQCHTAVGMASPRELVKQRLDAIPGSCQGRGVRPAVSGH
jgi:hypothetical protein